MFARPLSRRALLHRQTKQPHPDDTDDTTVSCSPESMEKKIVSLPTAVTNAVPQIPAFAASLSSCGSLPGSISHNVLDAENMGLWIRLIQEQDDDDTTIKTTTVFTREYGQAYPHIHPHANAPASLHQVRALSGGGSGTAVFGATHADAGTLVLKHGGAKDTLEVLSLAEIAAQLQERGRSNNNKAASSTEAASFMQARLPALVGVFCAPHHLRDRGQEKWNTVRQSHEKNRLSLMVDTCLNNNQDDNDSDSSSSEEEEDTDNVHEQIVQQQHLRLSSQRPNYRRVVSGSSQGTSRRIRLQKSNTNAVGLEVFFRSVIFQVPNLEPADDRHSSSTTMVLRHDVYDFWQKLAVELSEEQQLNSWKVTLMQKTIGGPNSVNGAQVLTSGNLCGSLLDKVLQEFTCIIRHLQTLTWPQERGGLQAARAEYLTLLQSRNVEAISKTTNEFCGAALCKNYMPHTGRFARLRAFGRDFRSHELMLEPVERFPASFLGACLKPGAKWHDIFSEPSASMSALDRLENAWLDVLHNATCLDDNVAVTDRIWTCGLTDAGLHNTFVCQDRGLELFDLGKPQLMPVPAFLTKFLMSYFHALGMEETQENGTTTWVRRFQIVGGKLCPTKDTQALLPSIYEAFGQTMNHFVDHIFHGDERVRRLMLQYVVLQLLSDGAFCLERWEEKGGGRERFGKQLQGDLQKWLWRGLWDVYIASEVYEKLVRVLE